MKAATLSFLLFCAVACAAQNPTPAQNPDIPKGMKQYFVGFLVKGEKFDPKMPADEHDKLMKKHLAYIRSQAEAGKYRLAGPFLDDGNIEGLLIIDAPTAEDAKQIVSGDPMVQIGRLAIELHPALLANVSCVLADYGTRGGK